MSARPEFKGDYMGFTYGNTHSSELGIVRVSNGSRFDENLLPTMQDKTVPIPGGDGTYYFGTYYTQRQFTVPFAFDGLTEAEVSRIREYFSGKEVRDLMFDERPYKCYRAKVTGTATLKYVVFAEGNTNRLYRGEGSVQFTCYDPFARCWSTTKNNYLNHPAYLGLSQEEALARIDEWWSTANIDATKNFGNVPVPFTMTMSGSGSRRVGGFSYSWDLPAGITATLNTKTGTVTAGNANVLYNKYVNGNFTAKIPVNGEVPSTVSCTCLYI